MRNLSSLARGRGLPLQTSPTCGCYQACRSSTGDSRCLILLERRRLGREAYGKTKQNTSTLAFTDPWWCQHLDLTADDSDDKGIATPRSRHSRTVHGCAQQAPSSSLTLREGTVSDVGGAPLLSRGCWRHPVSGLPLDNTSGSGSHEPQLHRFFFSCDSRLLSASLDIATNELSCLVWSTQVSACKSQSR